MFKYFANELLKQSNNIKLWFFIALETFLGWLLQFKFFREALEVFPYWRTSNEGKSFDDFIFIGSNFYAFLWVTLTSVLITVLLLEVDISSKLSKQLRIIPINRFNLIFVKLNFFLIIISFSTFFIALYYYQNVLELSRYYSQNWDFSIKNFSLYFGLILILSNSLFLINFSIFCFYKFRLASGVVACIILNFALFLVPYSPQYIMKKHHLFTLQNELFDRFVLASIWLLISFSIAFFSLKKKH